jgi:hypothetical protein
MSKHYIFVDFFFARSIKIDVIRTNRKESSLRDFCHSDIVWVEFLKLGQLGILLRVGIKSTMFSEFLCTTEK